MWILSTFMFKRDRWNLILWFIGLIILNVAVAGAFGEMFQTQDELMSMVATFANPAIIAMVGPIYSYSIAGIFTQSMLVFVAISVAIMNIFMVSRHTRADEEEGRLEVLRSLPIGRVTILKSVLLNSVIINIILALVIGLSVGATQMESGYLGSGISNFMGAIIYGAILGATGFVFAAFTALFVQLSENNRSVLSYSFMFLGVMYLLRAIGDMNIEILSIISPLGIGFRAQPFVGNYIWPIFILIITSIIVSLLAIYLNGIRDLGAGFIAQKPGNEKGNFLLKSQFGLAFKLTKGSLIGWAITTFVLGASYGSVFGDIETFINSNDIFRQLFAGIEGQDLTLGFMSFIVVVMAIVCTIPVITSVYKVKGEENKNRLEHILGRSISRTKIIISYTIVSIIKAPIMLFLVGFGLYVASFSVMDDPLPFKSLTRAVMAYLPALWMFTGLAALIVGLLPKLTGIIWAYLGYSLVTAYFGQLLELPEIMNKLTPFGHIPTYPLEIINLEPLVIITIISILLVVGGVFGYRKRDILG